MQLPTRRELPDYYDVIAKPMDFNKLKKKILQGRYQSIDELEKDMHLLCENAQTYNEDGSLIFNDSVILKQVWDLNRDRHSEEISATMRELERELSRETSQQPDDDESRSSFSATPAPTPAAPELDTQQDSVTPSGSIASEEATNLSTKSEDGKESGRRKKSAPVKRPRSMLSQFGGDVDMEDASDQPVDLAEGNLE